MHLSAKYASTWYPHIGPWTWGLRWIDVPFQTLMYLSWKVCGRAVDVPFGHLMGLRAPARTICKLVGGDWNTTFIFPSSWKCIIPIDEL